MKTKTPFKGDISNKILAVIWITLILIGCTTSVIVVNRSRDVNIKEKTGVDIDTLNTNVNNKIKQFNN